MKYTAVRNSRGVALLAALFVMMVLSILGTWMLLSVNDELRMSKSIEGSERALKIAEAGVQVARSTFFRPASASQSMQTQELKSIDGFYQGGYFLAQLQSGFQGKEKWTQWRYDAGASGTNRASQIIAPVFPVWQSGALGVNGTWQGTWFMSEPIYGMVARGLYFAVQNSTGDTLIRAHDEYTGSQKVDRDDSAFPQPYYWLYDKSGKTSAIQYAAHMTPMTSFSNYTTKAAGADAVLSQQTIYYVYSGDTTNRVGGVDTTSTVRLRAINALCHGTSPYDTNGANMNILWEFDTGLHGMGTAPVFFDPDLGLLGAGLGASPSGDKVIYFAVISKGRPGTSRALDLRLTFSSSPEYTWQWPAEATDDPEQIYIFAVVDTSAKPSTACSSTGTYKVKWTKAFPDPDVAEWTDYPTEHLTGTNGLTPPYLRVPANVSVPPLPEEDVLPDFRDGPGNTVSLDNQRNQMRGTLVQFPTAVGPVILNVFYRKADGTLTEDRNLATTDLTKTGNRFDPLIDLYLMYAAFSRVMSYSTYAGYADWRGPNSSGGAQAWGPPGYRNPNVAQVRVLALRDRLARNGANGTWNWNAAKSRFPKFKWNYLLPSWDPDSTNASPDERPGNGYGEYNWDNWFYGNLAPVVNVAARDQTNLVWNSVTDASNTVIKYDGVHNGQCENVYPVIYPYGAGSAFFTYWGFDNRPGTAPGPTLAQGSPINFSGDSWADTHALLMAARDTWDDYMRGFRTNILGQNLKKLNLDISNPVEHYWTHRDNSNNFNGEPASTSLAFPQYNAVTPSAGGQGKIGFPRPYMWSERLWIDQVRANLFTSSPAWADPNGPARNRNFTSGNIDVTRSTPALCRDCLNNQGLVLWTFIQNIIAGSTTAGTPAYYSSGGGFSGTADAEDTRWHAINATTGAHAWAYSAPSSLQGYDDTNSPTIAHNIAFLPYENWGDKTTKQYRISHLAAVNADNGQLISDVKVDTDSDGIIMAPVVANGAVYVATYDANGTRGGGATAANDQIRVFALSPVLRLVSTGVYWNDPRSYRNYTSKGFKNITMLDHDTIFKNQSGVGIQNTWVRRVQVWVTGGNSKWEEVREVLKN